MAEYGLSDSCTAVSDLAKCGLARYAPPNQRRMSTKDERTNRCPPALHGSHDHDIFFQSSFIAGNATALPHFNLLFISISYVIKLGEAGDKFGGLSLVQSIYGH